MTWSKDLLLLCWWGRWYGHTAKWWSAPARQHRHQLFLLGLRTESGKLEEHIQMLSRFPMLSYFPCSPLYICITPPIYACNIYRMRSRTVKAKGCSNLVYGDVGLPKVLTRPKSHPELLDFHTHCWCHGQDNHVISYFCWAWGQSQESWSSIFKFFPGFPCWVISLVSLCIFVLHPLYMHAIYVGRDRELSVPRDAAIWCVGM